MKHLQFDTPAVPAMEGFVESLLKPLFDFFKGKAKPTDKINLNHVPYKFQLQGLKNRIQQSYGSLEALRGDELVKGPLRGMGISAYLTEAKIGTPDPDYVPALVHKALYDVTEFLPRLQQVCNHYNAEVLKLLAPVRRESINLMEEALAQLDDGLKNLTHRFKMPTLPSTGIYGNLYINAKQIAELDPNDSRLVEARLKLNSAALKKNWGGHLPVLTKDQIVTFSKVMCDILTVLETSENYTRYTPALPAPDDPSLKTLHDFSANAGHYNEYLWIVLTAQQNAWFLPRRIAHSYEEFLGNCVIAMDHWITRSLK